MGVDISCTHSNVHPFTFNSIQYGNDIFSIYDRRLIDTKD